MYGLRKIRKKNLTEKKIKFAFNFFMEIEAKIFARAKWRQKIGKLKNWRQKPLFMLVVNICGAKEKTFF